MTGHPLSRRIADVLTLQPDAPAIEFDGRWISWGQIGTAARRVGSSLRGTDVGMLLRNRPAHVAALLGVLMSGATVVTINPSRGDERTRADIAELRLPLVLGEPDDLTTLVNGKLSTATVSLDGIFDGPGGRPEVARQCSGVAVRMLTSGTTGPPKSFAVPYALLERHFLSTPLTRQQADDPQAAPPFLLYFPLGNITGLYSTLPMLLRGQRVELLERFSLSAWHAHVRRWRPSHGGLPPASVQAVLDADIAVEDLASLHAIGCGAAPLDPGVQQAFEARYGIPILLSYGATEFAGPVASMTAALHAEWGARKIGSVGRAMPGAELRIVDPESGVPLPSGAEGLLEVISPRIGQDWIRTSDIALIDADDFLFLRGRADGAIIRGGFKLLPESIERALMLHPAIAEAAVTGMADHRLGQVPAAAIRLHADFAAPAVAALETHVRQHLPATHVPVKWLFVRDLPRTPSLKTDRRALQALFANMSPQTQNETENIT